MFVPTYPIEQSLYVNLVEEQSIACILDHPIKSVSKIVARLCAAAKDSVSMSMYWIKLQILHVLVREVVKIAMNVADLSYVVVGHASLNISLVEED